MLELSLTRNGKLIMRHPIADGLTTIGRSAKNSIHLLEPEISRHHCRLELKGGNLQVFDLSTNGTFVNGEVKKMSKLTVGDKLSLGRWTLTVENQKDTVPAKTIFRSASATKVVEYNTAKKSITSEAIELTIQSPNQIPVVRKITSSEATIGHHASCDVAIADQYVSRRHCKITEQNGALSLVDLGSTNGTYINGIKIEETRLPPEGSFKIGKSTVGFRLVRTSEKIAVSKKENLGEIIAKSKPMREIFSLIERIGPTDATVCVTGESGTGKELVAREIHNLSARKDKPFVAINCSAVPESIIEGQLFGHERGAFTGAVERSPGLFEQAKKGTLFLDEIGEMPLDLQTRLLRVLESKTVRRVGGQEEIPVDVRIICATNQNLKRLVGEGRFREDLFFRIFVIPIKIPPLRERAIDIPALIEHFMDKACKPHFPRSLTEDALDACAKFPWPGNVRELKNTIERTLLLCTKGQIGAKDICFETVTRAGGEGASFRDREREIVETAVKESAGNLSLAARKLNMARTTMQKKVRRLKIEVSKKKR